MSDANTSETRRRKPRRAPSPEERRRDPERTKARILDAATEVFSAKGFAGARVADIASRAGVNHQLITYYFGGKAGLYREIGRRWRDHERQEYPDGLPLPEVIRRVVLDTAGGAHGSRFLAWQGLTDTGADDPDALERNARLQHEVAQLRRQQQAGELDGTFDPAALMLIAMSASNALTVYPHIARGLFNTADTDAPEVIEHYADQLAQLFGRLVPSRT